MVGIIIRQTSRPPAGGTIQEDFDTGREKNEEKGNEIDAAFARTRRAPGAQHPPLFANLAFWKCVSRRPRMIPTNVASHARQVTFFQRAHVERPEIRARASFPDARAMGLTYASAIL